MTDDDGDERTTWVPIAIAGAFVAIVLTAILTIDGSSDESGPTSPVSPTSSVTP